MTPPVLVIGAPRSGTNLLRDLLCRLPGHGTWPCDEINPIWRHGNLRHPSDELRPDQATPDVKRFVVRAFTRLQDREDLETVVEKTCANSLRVAFVGEILPHARFVFLLRDGRDAIASAIERWQAPLDLAYTLRKARFVPLGDLPHHLWAFSRRRLSKICSRTKSLPSWGPRFENLEEVLREHGIAGACAEQWLRCVELASRDLRDVGADRLIGVRYQDLVRRPAKEMRRLACFLGTDLDEDRARRMTSDVSSSSLGLWRIRLSPEQQSVVDTIVRPRFPEVSRLLASAGLPAMERLAELPDRETSPGQREDAGKLASVQQAGGPGGRVA